MRALPLTAQASPLLPKLGEAGVTRLTLLLTASEPTETRHRRLEAAVGTGIDAGLIEAVEYTMCELSCGVQDVALLRVLIHRRDASTKLLFQSGVLDVEALG